MNEYGAPVEWYWQDNKSTLRKLCPTASLSITNLETDLGLNQDLGSGSPVTKHLSHGTALTLHIMSCFSLPHSLFSFHHVLHNMMYV